MLNEFSRTELLIGEKAMKKLSSASVIVFGVGGVGSYCVESLVRSGIGKIVLVDNDIVSLTNINRQLIATHKTVGKLKVDVAKERILEINPTCVVETHACFYSQDETDGIDLSAADFVVDAIDSVKSKLFIISQCDQLKTPIISCMGAGNKLDPTKFKIADIYKTEMCPLAKVMRRELRIMGIKHLKVLFSTEPAIRQEIIENSTEPQVPGSIAFVPSTAGLIISSEVVKFLISEVDTAK